MIKDVMSSNSNPTISVLMPVYNGEAYLREAMDSILGQTFTDFEFLIINDGSTDQSKEIILSYTDPRIRYVENETNLRLIATLNKGIDLCKGKYIARMDADDISLPHRLQNQFEYMEKYPDVGLVGTWYQSFDDKGITGICKYLPTHEEICFKQLYQIHISHGTCMIRKIILEETAIRFDKEFAYAEDYDMFTRLSRITRSANIQEVGYLVRKHDGEVSFKFAEIQKENSNKVRFREFKKLGIDITNDELEAFISLNHQSYSNIKLQANNLASFLNRIIISNAQTKYISTDFFSKMTKNLWFNYCYNVKSFIYYQRNKHLAVKIPTMTIAKWLFKQIIT